MLDIGWSELAVVAVLALLVIGPKDLPGVMRTVGKWMQKARSISREFQSSVDEMVREAELEDARKALDSAKNLNVQQTIENAIDPTGEVKETARELDREARREDPAEPAENEANRKDSSVESEPKAEIVKHPVKIAPPHSVTPPLEPGAPEPEAPAAAAKAAVAEPDDKTASGGAG